VNRTVVGIAVLLYNLTLIVGATYLVVEYSWSMWIYLLAALFITSFKTGNSDV
jgi:hypothetical protein